MSGGILTYGVITPWRSMSGGLGRRSNQIPAIPAGSSPYGASGIVSRDEAGSQQPFKEAFIMRRHEPNFPYLSNVHLLPESGYYFLVLMSKLLHPTLISTS